ncbi:AAA family ATPase [Catenulispora yoronensis]
MKRYVLTGTPGAGKTTVIEELRRRGHAVVGEAATEVIARRQAAGEAEPWEAAGFVDLVLDVQREWERGARRPATVCASSTGRRCARWPSAAISDGRTARR